MKIEEFIQRLDDVQTQYPVESEKVLRKGANKMKKELVDASPDGPGKKRKIKKSWRMKVEGITAKGIEAQLTNKSPHYHLVERGHVIKDRWGHVHGFHQGKKFKFTEKTVNAKKGQINKEMGEQLFKMLGDKFG